MSRERLTLGPCATVNQQQPWMRMANHKLSRHNVHVQPGDKTTDIWFQTVYYMLNNDTLFSIFSDASNCMTAGNELTSSDISKAFPFTSDNCRVTRVCTYKALKRLKYLEGHTRSTGNIRCYVTTVTTYHVTQCLKRYCSTALALIMTTVTVAHIMRCWCVNTRV